MIISIRWSFKHNINGEFIKIRINSKLKSKGISQTSNHITLICCLSFNQVISSKQYYLIIFKMFETQMWNQQDFYFAFFLMFCVFFIQIHINVCHVFTFGLFVCFQTKLPFLFILLFAAGLFLFYLIAQIIFIYHGLWLSQTVCVMNYNYVITKNNNQHWSNFRWL